MPDIDNTRTHQPGDNYATRTSAPVPDPDATLLKPQGQSAPLAPETGGTTVPGFEIEGEIGRGGMGVVYRAKQVGLNRTVALKMLLAGPFASASLRARFLLEAESVAALEHPHIVKVHAFGEHGAHPYLAMEYLPGGTLADRVKKSGPLRANEATELVAKLAGAVAHAHSRGVVHRDLKPLNVMFAGDGEPRVTDFGLAKVGRADQNLSVTGQVLGTPAYMAPEQAAGKIREVGTAADVYALGALLYDALTGRPPFQGDSAAVTLQKVLTEEPQRPRKLNAAIPHDLETICLKCLEKDHSKRYPTAQALADDLLRYSRNEPISARSAGSLERGCKWVKRNKKTAGAITTVTLAVLVAASFSIVFGVEARRQKGEAEAAAKREEEEKLNALAAQSELQRKSAELKLLLARSLVAPLAARKSLHPLTPYEVNALWQLSDLRQEDVSWLFLAEATRTSLTSEQFASRAPYAFHAMCGLDRARRDSAGRLLLQRLTDPSTEPRRNIVLARAWLRADNFEPELATEVARILGTSLGREVDPDTCVELASCLHLLREHVLPTHVPEVDALIAGRPIPPEPLEPVDENILRPELESAVADVQRAKTGAPVEGIQYLLQRILQSGDLTRQRERLDGLREVAERLSPAEAAAVARTIAGGFEGEESSYGWWRRAECLSRVAARLPATESDALCVPLAIKFAAELKGATLGYYRNDIAAALVAVCSTLEPTKAEPFLTGAVERMRAIQVRSALEDLSPALRAPGAAPALVREILGETGFPRSRDTEAHDGIALCRLLIGLERVAQRTNPPRATGMRLQALRVLVDALHHLSEHHLEIVDDFFPDIVSRASSADALEAVAIFEEAIVREKNAAISFELALGLAEAAVRVPPAPGPPTAARAAALLAGMLREPRPSSARKYVGRRTFAAVSARLDPPVASRLALELLSRQRYADEQADCARAVAAVIARMDPDQADEIGAQAVKMLAARLNGDDSQSSQTDWACGFAEVVAVLRARSAAIALSVGFSRATTPSGRRALARGARAVCLGLPIERTNFQCALLLPIGGNAMPGHVPASLPILHPYFHPQPRPLPPQELVELLKHPFCVGELRRAVLDALELTYKRSFKDQWEFVEYVQRYNVHDHTTGKPLDLLTPPKRPEPKP